MKGFRYDNLERRAMIRKTTERLLPEMLEATDAYRRPVTKG
jgi:hydrogenase-4 component H